MTNFVIYEDEKKYTDLYISIINKVMEKSKEKYRIFKHPIYNPNLKEHIKTSIGNNIYILDIQVPGKKGLDLAREIRNSNDWNSQIIISTSHEELTLENFNGKLLTLDFISKCRDYEKELMESLTTAYNILNKRRSLGLLDCGIINQVSYEDILYIEKNVEDLTCKIVLDNEEIEVRYSLKALDNELKHDKRFFRTHRSCIVNLEKIKTVDFPSTIIYFKNKKTDLLSRDKKSDLKDRLYYQKHIKLILD